MPIASDVGRMNNMRPEDIRAYAGRPWQQAEQRKVDWWRRQKEQYGAEEALRVVEELRQAGLEAWPEAFSARARRADFENHARLAKAFQAIAVAISSSGSRSGIETDEARGRAVVPLRGAIRRSLGTAPHDGRRRRHR
jgi:hypothetical protein